MICYKEIFVMILIVQLDSMQNKDNGTDSETTTELISACPLKNFSVVSKVHHDNPKFINLHISWEKFDDQGTIRIYQIDNRTDCYRDFYKSDFSLLDNSLVTPRVFLTDNEVKPGCEYEISIESETNSSLSNFLCFYNHTVPECVEDICDCDKFKPEPKILSIEHVSGDEFLVKWDPGEKTRNHRFYKTKGVEFKYYLSSKLITFQLESAVELVYDLQKKSSLISMKLVDGENYTLRGIFRNNFSCSWSDEFYFTGPIENNYSIKLIIGVVALVLGFLIAMQYKKIVKYKNKLLDCKHSHRIRERNELEPIRLQEINIPMNANLQYIPAENLDARLSDGYEFSRNKIILKEVIGSGAFGRVYSAKAIGIGGIEGYRMVAVKTLTEDENVTREATNDFLAEVEIFKKIGHHSNIVALLGCCTIETPYMMIMELIPCGDLKKYLLDLREQWLKNQRLQSRKQVFFPDNRCETYVEAPASPATLSTTSSRLPSTPETVFTTLEDPMTPLLAHFALEKILDHRELQSFALQIARGMAHLEKISVTHRDLAARNILINEHKTLKISDFGLSRSGPYINHRTKRLPLRWMAIEAIVDQKYDNRSDVWSFGVVLWEIGTLGAFPYESVPDSLIQQFLQMGRRLERPEICTDVLYSLMNECWAEDPKERPTFQELVEALDVRKRKVYVNFDQLNPTYVFPPSDQENHIETVVRIVDIGS